MRKFIIKFLIFILIIIAIVVIFTAICKYLIGNQYTNMYQASIYDKIERLENIDGPKIVLVGNSNVAFGINSEMIEKEIKMPVVNLGLHGALRNEFHENMAKTSINEGDIIILAHSDYSNDDSIGDYILAWSTVEWNKKLWSLIPKDEYSMMLRYLPIYQKNTFISFVNKKINKRAISNSTVPKDCYSRYAFNEYGDNVYSMNDNSLYNFTKKLSVPQIDDVSVKRINELNRYCKSKGATLLIAAYPIADGEYTPNHELYSAFEKELREKMDCPVISKFSDYFIDYKYFYNTELHLTYEGAKIRTNLLINDIKNYMNEQSK